MKLEDLKKDFPNLNFEWQTEIKKVTDKLSDWFFVGGCVRDSLLNTKKITDIDITTQMTPDQIENSMKEYKIITIGKKFGTIAVFFRGYQIEITTTRMDVTHYGRKADVQFGASFFEDSCRRDFTINALLFNKELIDHHEGILDLKIGKVKFIGDAIKRIKEDYLRILRYIRFFLKFENSSFIGYQKEIRQNLDGLSYVSLERIFSEFEKMFQIDAKKAIDYSNQLGITKHVFGDDFSKPNWFSSDHKENIAYAMIFWKKTSNLPLNKVTSSILSLKEKYRDFFANCAFIWSRKGEEALARFTNLKKALGKQYVIPNIRHFQKQDLSSFSGEERGQAEIAVRYLFFAGKEISTRNILECIQYLKSSFIT